MPNPYVNKVVQSNGTTLIDISDTTAVASDVAEGKYFYLATGEKVEGTGEGGGSVTWETLYEGNATIVSSSPNYISITNFPETIGEGETWRITWDGTPYTCTAVYDSQISGYYIGNARIVASGYPDTGEPFWAYKRTSSQLAFSTNQSAGTVTLVIERQTTSSATLITKTITANGTYSASDDSADGYSSVTVNVSGGASNIVTGTFKGTTTGAAMDVDLAYTGNGYPVAVNIYPIEGAYNASTGSIYSLVQRFVTLWYTAIKNYSSSSPNYDGSGTDDSYSMINRYKNSTTNAQTYGHSVQADIGLAYNTDASSSGSGKYVVRFKAKNKMSVMIASNSYGFPANIEFKYQIIYSS